MLYKVAVDGGAANASAAVVSGAAVVRGKCGIKRSWSAESVSSVASGEAAALVNFIQDLSKV